MKIKKICAILILYALVVSIFSPSVFAEEDGTSLFIKIHEIEMIDAVEFLPGDSADWSYKINIEDNEGMNIDGTLGWIDCEENNNNPMPNNIHEFTVNSALGKIEIIIAERDSGNYDIADISDKSGGGTDDWTGGSFPYGSTYEGNYNLITDSLSGDSTIIENDYYKTSGDYDGSDEPDTDQNDAHLWFDIIENYDSPNADAGPDHTIETGDKVNFDGGQSSASEDSTITGYKWDIDGDGIWDFQNEIASYNYMEGGNYTVTLQVTDNIGTTDMDTCLISVKEPQNQEPPNNGNGEHNNGDDNPTPGIHFLVILFLAIMVTIIRRNNYGY